MQTQLFEPVRQQSVGINTQCEIGRRNRATGVRGEQGDGKIAGWADIIEAKHNDINNAA